MTGPTGRRSLGASVSPFHTLAYFIQERSLDQRRYERHLAEERAKGDFEP